MEKDILNPRHSNIFFRIRFLKNFRLNNYLFFLNNKKKLIFTLKLK